MRIYDIIKRKRYGEILNSEEIRYFVEEYTANNISDSQAAALLMAICCNGMNSEETLILTEAMAHSGEMVDLTNIEGIKVDKHSTGGVGDKTTLIVAPIIAACGVKVAKMSGRGLGHTGGTIDKLEAITGYRTNLTPKEFFEVVENVGVSIIGQSFNIAPADKKIYALRDITATVDSIPLIASSIMSKKIASGADCIVLDVKVGSGAFCKDLDYATSLAHQMVAIGISAGRKVRAILTNMDIPLGNAVGNSLEIIEAINVLKGQGNAELTEVSKILAANMLNLAGVGNIEECNAMVTNALNSGKAFDKFVEMVIAQGGDKRLLYDTGLFDKAKYISVVRANQSGYISKMNTELIGITSVILGAGRMKKEDFIDYSAGIIIQKKTGDKVKAGDVIATLYTNNISCQDEASSCFNQAIEINEEKPSIEKLIYGVIDA